MKPLKPFASIILISMLLAACGSPTATPSPPPRRRSPPRPGPPPRPPSAGAAARPRLAQPAPPPPPPRPPAAFMTAISSRPRPITRPPPARRLTPSTRRPCWPTWWRPATCRPLAERLPTDVAIVRTREGPAAQYGGEMHLLGFFEGAGVFSAVHRRHPEGADRLRRELQDLLSRHRQGLGAVGRQQDPEAVPAARA